MLKSAKKPLLLPLLVLVMLGVGVWAYRAGWLSTETVEGLVERAGPFAPLWFVLIYAVATGLCLPGTPFTLAGGALFGPVWGSLYVIVGATLGAVIGFWIARLFAGEALHEFLKKRVPTIHAYSEQLKKQGFLTVLILRLIPIFPFSPLNYAMGLITHLKFWPYFFATLIGIAPATIAYTAFGSSLTSGNIGAIVAAFAVIVLLGVVLSRMKHHFVRS